jgi:miniconductance mechanosensitive channel
VEQWSNDSDVITLIALGSVAVAALVVYVIARWGIVGGIRFLIHRSTMTWDDALTENRVFVRLAHIAPAIVLYYGITRVPGLTDDVQGFVQRLAVAMMLTVAALSLTSFLDAVNVIYSRNEEYAHRPIKGYLQVGKMVVFLLTALVVIATLLDKSPWLFLSGIGAMTAVLMLVFKDTILSLVASVQIASNDMIHIGDWIEMPQAGADGDVVDVALHTVKVQNWDKTISTIPTHKFIDESFKNWRGMSLSGGRRIKRALMIDMTSVRFLGPREIERFGEWALLREYVAEKVAEIAGYNARPGLNAEIAADVRQLTNVGMLRAYIERYLASHPKIHHEGYTLMVRQLSPGPTGLPIEIYCFSNDQDWGRYEGIQADIFDHIIAMVPEFELRLFQEPTGADFGSLATGQGTQRTA